MKNQLPSSFPMTFCSLIVLILLIGVSCTSTQSNEGIQAAFDINARAESLELNTPYNPPLGDPLSHHAAGFAKVLCSAVFVTGLDFDFAAEHIGYFSAPYEERSKFTDRRLDRENKSVHVTLPDGTIRTAKYFGDLGCSCLPHESTEPFFEPIDLVSSLPEANITPWPMGDENAAFDIDPNVDLNIAAQAVEAAFNHPDGMTAAYVVTHKGQIIGERYAEGIDMHTSLESWSMGKSLTATLMGVLIQQEAYTLHQPAPIPEWQGNEDLRKDIRISDILRMSSGIRFRGLMDPDFNPELGYPDHLYVYTGTVNSFTWTASLPPQWPPNKVGRYRNCDPVLTNYLIRLAVENRGDNYHQFPTKALFDKIGMRDMVLETDPYGNFLLQGYDLGSARDWARLGNLYLQDGVWDGERILPEGFVNFVSTLAPGWEADQRPIYGGFFWLNGNQSLPIPKEAYYMAGAGGQRTIIIPSHDLVVVRLGHYKGNQIGMEDLNASLKLWMQAVPESQ